MAQYPLPGAKKLIRTRAAIVINTLLPGTTLTWVYRKKGVDAPVSVTVVDTDPVGKVFVVDTPLSFVDKDLVNLKIDLPAGDPGVGQTVVLNWAWEFVPV